MKLAAGSLAMRPPEKTAPLFRFEGRVTTSGRAIYGRVSRIVVGGYMPLEAIATMPTVQVNGLDVGSPATLVNTGEHEGFVLFLPREVKVERDDTLTLSAPQAWATVKNDFCEAMDDQPIEVCTGRSFVGTEAIRPTLKIGLNFGHLVTPYWGTFSLQKNLRFRIQRWDHGVNGYDARGFPASMNAETADAFFIADNNQNGIDNTGTPAPEGLDAVGWGRANFGWLLGKVPEGGMLWQVRRTGQIHRRFVAVFAEQDRRAEVRSILNMQLCSAGAVRVIVKQAIDEGLPPPDIAIAPYVEFGRQPSLVKALNLAELDQAVDLWIWNFVYGRVPEKSGPVLWCEAQRKTVDAVN